VTHGLPGGNAFEFVMVATLRSEQLRRGCTPRVPKSHRWILTAQLEVAAGKVRADARTNGDGSAPALTGDGLEPVVARGPRMR
jgi:DNA-directed RNA polymerase subunit K/omega